MRQCPECNELFEGIRCSKCGRLFTKEELERFQKAESKKSKKFHIACAIIVIACIGIVVFSVVFSYIQQKKISDMVTNAFFDNQSGVPFEDVIDEFKEKWTSEETTASTSNVVTLVDQELIYDENNKIKISGDYSGERLALIVLLAFDGKNIEIEVARMLAINLYISNNELTSYLFNGDYTVTILSGENGGLAKYNDYNVIEPTVLPITYSEFMNASDKEQIGALAIEEYNFILKNMKYIKDS